MRNRHTQTADELGLTVEDLEDVRLGLTGDSVDPAARPAFPRTLVTRRLSSALR